MNYNVIGTDGAVYGPVDLDALKKWVAEARVLPNTMLEEIGSGRRFEAKTMTELFPAASAPSASVLHGGYEAPKAGTTGASQVANTPGGLQAAAQRIGGQTGYSSISANAPIDNHMLQAILSTLCCCLPIGLVAVIFSASVNGKVAAGDRAGAHDAAEKAKITSNIAIGLGITGMLIYAGFVAYGIYLVRSGQITVPPPKTGAPFSQNR